MKGSTIRRNGNAERYEYPRSSTLGNKKNDLPAVPT